MTVLQGLILGIVQGLTEFLPVSSSAHLVVVPWALGWQFEPRAAFAFDVLVQVGSLVAVIVYFGRDLIRWAAAFVPGQGWTQPERAADRRLIGWVVVGTLPAVIFGLVLKERVEVAFSRPAEVMANLLITAGLLTAGEWLHRRDLKTGRSAGRTMEQVSVRDAIWIGLFQAAALFPGVSRSGATISAGIAGGLQRPSAARFSFLLSIPALLGAGIVAAADLRDMPGPGEFLPALAVGFVSAAVVGYFSIRGLVAFLGRRPVYVFAVYCLAVGLAGLILTVVGG